MNAEKRTIRASVLAGVTDILFGLLMYFTGYGDWYYAKFHMFGIIGFGMLAYGYWHLYFYNIETGERVWKMKQQKK